MASIVQRGGSYSVVYYTKENGIRKQKWESFRTEKDALHRKYMVEQYQQVKKELAHRPQTVGQLIQEYVWFIWQSKMVTVHVHIHPGIDSELYQSLLWQRSLG